jgi:peptide-methionine (S)-S-oxide reductase
VIRTRVGYAGGTKENPTYRDLGDHSETIQIEYDPTQISYEELLDVFWNTHTPTSRPWSRQYASIVFYHDEAQRELALKTKEQQEAKRGTIFTQIVPAGTFYPAEDYHQKYYLRNARDLTREFSAMYPDGGDFAGTGQPGSLFCQSGQTQANRVLRSLEVAEKRPGGQAKAVLGCKQPPFSRLRLRA